MLLKILPSKVGTISKHSSNCALWIFIDVISAFVNEDNCYGAIATYLPVHAKLLTLNEDL